MSKHAAFVVGADISEDAIKHAQANYNKSNLSYVRCDASNLAFPSNSFDVVASFETIEHLIEQEAMLREIRRVLHPGGILLMSSPNKPVYSAENRDNDFHVKELDFDEFNSLLRDFFPHVDFYGQRLMMGSVIQPLYSACKTGEIWSDDGAKIVNEAPLIEDPVYFIAICSDKKSSLKKLRMSALYPASFDLVKHYIGFAKWAENNDARISTLCAEVADRDEQITDRDEQITSLTEETVRRGQWALSLDAQLKEEQSKLIALTKIGRAHV